MKTGTFLAIGLFSLVAIAHLVRLVIGIDIIAGGYTVPQWVSVFGVAVPSLIAWLLWREGRGG
jgi:hypothetical protein